MPKEPIFEIACRDARRLADGRVIVGRDDGGIGGIPRVSFVAIEAFFLVASAIGTREGEV